MTQPKKPKVYASPNDVRKYLDALRTAKGSSNSNPNGYFQAYAAYLEAVKSCMSNDEYWKKILPNPEDRTQFRSGANKAVEALDRAKNSLDHLWVADEASSLTEQLFTQMMREGYQQQPTDTDTAKTSPLATQTAHLIEAEGVAEAAKAKMMSAPTQAMATQMSLNTATSPTSSQVSLFAATMAGYMSATIASSMSSTMTSSTSVTAGVSGTVSSFSANHTSYTSTYTPPPNQSQPGMVRLDFKSPPPELNAKNPIYENATQEVCGKVKDACIATYQDYSTKGYNVKLETGKNNAVTITFSPPPPPGQKLSTEGVLQALTANLANKGLTVYAADRKTVLAKPPEPGVIHAPTANTTAPATPPTPAKELKTVTPEMKSKMFGPEPAKELKAITPEMKRAIFGPEKDEKSTSPATTSLDKAKTEGAPTSEAKPEATTPEAIRAAGLEKFAPKTESTTNSSSAEPKPDTTATDTATEKNKSLYPSLDDHPRPKYS